MGYGTNVSLNITQLANSEIIIFNLFFNRFNNASFFVFTIQNIIGRIFPVVEFFYSAFYAWRSFASFLRLSSFPPLPYPMLNSGGKQEKAEDKK